MINLKCPVCGESHYSVGICMCTAAYYEPIYRNGVNINPDRNITTTNYHCLDCKSDWMVESQFDMPDRITILCNTKKE